MTLEEKILASKIWLAKKKNFPFFAYLLFQLKLVADKNVPITATDGEHLFYNEEFLNKCSLEQIRGLFLHETMHIALGHLWRVGNKDKMIYNIAGDFCINLVIKDNYKKGISLPTGVCMEEKYRGWFSEQIYYDIIDKVKKVEVSFIADPNGNPNAKFKPCGSSNKWSQKDKSKLKKLEKKWNREIKKAAEIYKKDIGDLPGELQRLVEDVEPHIPWQIVLLNYILPSYDDYSYSRPDKRLLYSSFIFPSQEEGEKIEDVIIALDTSGSINQQEINEFVSEVKSLLKSFQNIQVYICSCDTRIYNWTELNTYKKDFKITGCGGTSFIPVFEEVKKRNINPSVLLYFTDGYGSFPQEIPDYPVIWLMPKNYQNPPFGRKLILKN